MMSSPSTGKLMTKTFMGNWALRTTCKPVVIKFVPPIAGNSKMFPCSAAGIIAKLYIY